VLVGSREWQSSQSRLPTSTVNSETANQTADCELPPAYFFLAPPFFAPLLAPRAALPAGRAVFLAPFAPFALFAPLALLALLALFFAPLAALRAGAFLACAAGFFFAGFAARLAGRFVGAAAAPLDAAAPSPPAASGASATLCVSAGGIEKSSACDPCSSAIETSEDLDGGC
jgi:hypothetical protein